MIFSVGKSKIKFRWHQGAILCFILFLFFLIIYKLYLTWNKIPFDDLRFDTTNFILSLFLSYVFLLFSSACGIYGWMRILNATGEKVTFRQSFRLIGRALLSKYVPGGIWFAIGRIYLSKNENLSQQRVAVSTALDSVFLFLSAVLLVIPLELPLLLGRLTNFIPVLLASLVMGLGLAHPRVIQYLLMLCMRILKRSAVPIKGSYFEYLEVGSLYLILWVAQGLGFFFLCRTIYPLSWKSIGPVIGAYILSWVVGFLAFFSPGGLGVRDGILSVTLGGLVVSPLAILFSLLARVWITVYEIIYSAIAFYMDRDLH